MGNPRAKVLGLTFAMLAFASILLIVNEETVGANAWALLALSGVFAAGAVMAFFQQEEYNPHSGSAASQQIQEQQTESQKLPDPAEAGFDIPVL
ncbi:MAG: hypothetical protein VYB17_04185 [Candidatus Thermoplasmatota archaeon]|nr:hypothetical protein [Candidatus Thermoplasmatota archaeon]